MNAAIVKSVIDLLEEFELQNFKNTYTNDVNGFRNWMVNNTPSESEENIDWEGKNNGRSAESLLSTLIVHMNRFGKMYSKAAILNSEFSTQEDFIYLINLKAFGKMTKMDLIRKNVHEKPVGILIINRLLSKGWITQEDSHIDKRSKIISISEKGLMALEAQMPKIRQATNIVSGNLTHKEKLELIKLLSKLKDFHMDIYDKNINPDHILDEIKV